MRRSSLFRILLLSLMIIDVEHLLAQTLQVALSPAPKVNRTTSAGMATIFFDSSIEDLNIICTDENPDEQIIKDKDNENCWFINIDVKKDIEADGVCYRNFLLKSSSSGEYCLKTDAIKPNQVLYYTVFLPKIAGGVPLRVNASLDFGGDNMINKLPQRRLGHRNDTIKVYRNLRDYQYDQSYTITTKGLINNINIGDVLTFIPIDESFKSLSVTITDSIINSNEIKCTFNKKKSSLCGYVIDNYTHKPIPNCLVLLYLGNYDDIFADQKQYNIHLLQYKKLRVSKYFESGEAIEKYLTIDNGYFGWNNCVTDYTYYITVRSPMGYAQIGSNNGVNIKPKDNVKDSLIIKLKPWIVRGVVTNGKSAIPNVEIECETLYGKRIVRTGQDGKFEIIGPVGDYVQFKHNNYRDMIIKIDYDVYEKTVLTIQMKKGNQKMPLKGKYDCGIIKEIK